MVGNIILFVIYSIHMNKIMYFYYIKILDG